MPYLRVVRLLSRCGAMTACAWAAMPVNAAPAKDVNGVKLRSCFSRPTLGDSVCTVDPGHVFVESDLIDWTRTRGAGKRDDEIDLGVVTVRAGLGTSTDLTIDWTAFGHDRVRSATGTVTTRTGSGDVRIALRQAIRNPDGPGKGFSWGLLPFLSIPTGRTPFGSGTWSPGVVVPFGFPLAKGVTLGFSPQVKAVADDDGHGQHVAFGSVATLQVDVARPVTIAAELSEQRDRDPAGASTESLAAVELILRPRDGIQLDLSGVVGLNAASPDLRLFTGIAFRF